MNCHAPSIFFRRLMILWVSVGFVVASPAQNRVLELDGHGSYVELPPNIFKNLTEATVEVWAKWDRLSIYSRVFEFGAKAESVAVFNHAITSDLRFIVYPQNALKHPKLAFSARANGVVHSNEWIHIAAVSGPGGMKLYANGELVATHTNETTLADIKVAQTNLFGRGLMQNPSDRDFQGQLDEVRVWNHRRSEEQIRENLNHRLSGREAGLVGLWNFDDGQATDVSPGAHHGKLVGNARTVLPRLPDGLQLIAGDLMTAATAKPEITNVAPTKNPEALY